MRVATTLTCVALGAVLTVADAQTVYLPLDVGRQWSYASSSGQTDTRTVIGTRDLLGTEVAVIQHSESTYYNDLQTYWVTEPDGDVYFAGFLRADGTGYAYDPPACVLDAPPFPGRTWAFHSQRYSLPGGEPAGTYRGWLTVSWRGILSLPVGDIDCVSIAPADSFLVNSSFGYQSERASLSAPRLESIRWFAPDMGIVQFRDYWIYELVDYSTTAVEATSWGRIKALYR